MWVAEVKINGRNSLIGSRAKKYHVSLSGHPLSVIEKDNEILVSLAGFVFGEPSNITSFIRDIKNSERMLNFENKGNFIIAQITEPQGFQSAYDPRIIRLKPIFINEDGTETWVIGSWDKSVLNSFMDLYEKNHGAELVKIYQDDSYCPSVISVQPELTDSQFKAVEIAIKKGYYDYPRKIELKKLAEIMNLSYSTYQAHLRKAEKKLLPFFFESTKNTINIVQK